MTEFLLLATIFLVAGVVAVPLATRFGLGSVLGYLVAGIVISPILRWLHVDVTAIQHFAEFGVVMMLFLVGLELEPRLLWSMRGRLLGLGGLQVVLTAGLIAAACMLLGLYWTIAVALGLVFALSSTAIVLQTLNEKGLMRSDGGQASFSVLLFQDIAVIPMLAFIPLLAMPELMDSLPAAEHASESSDAGLSLVSGMNAWQTALVTIGAIGCVILAGIVLTRPLFRFVAMANLRELFTAAALAIVVGIALLMSLVGLSPALGTFLAGVVLASSEYRHELESDIDPFRGLLLGLFFITVGASIDFGLLASNAVAVIGLTLGLIILKAAVLMVLARLFGVAGAHRWLFSLGLAQAGEFGFVLLSFTVANEIVPHSVAQIALLIVTLSMLLTPGLFILYERVIAPKFSAQESREPDMIEEPARIIIAGHGRFGGIIARMLSSIGKQIVVLDYSEKQLEMLRAFGNKVYFGDATRPDLLSAAGIENAKLLVVAIDDRHQITELVQYVKRNYPYVHIVARSFDRIHTYELYQAGADDIIRETFDSAVRSGRSAYEALGFTHEEAEAMAAQFVESDKAHVRALAEAYRPGVPSHQNPEFVRLARALTDRLEEEMQQGRETATAWRRQPPESGSGEVTG
ncbi:monovalent cation:proton antiporter-2 (CPA2) family protein [Paracoccus aerodenitrificans]|uniref:monovalent cation:proton antiporter-2 (CPA2) family protein n=1 Tax=Paracoccus aerodenitrificans TaxID=3017781 RepID=UPI0022EFFA90|nr:monovalent cation:proton antiporter-2 (CPA2) family protein [Paracoccus aerodenitrificans]WBU63422.1 monovalent cation:proton antiporter-2 (CPA2) family protein [Paracoccus aerodenitrificans]